MADKLIIVESPAKAATIKKFLGGNVKVLASMGHIRDLPKSKLAIDIENDFTPEYINIRGKGDLIKTLKKEAKNAKNVYFDCTNYYFEIDKAYEDKQKGPSKENRNESIIGM